MRIILVNPPYIGWLNDIKVEPVGLLYIASFLRQHGHEVALWDPYIGEPESSFVDLLAYWRPRIVASAVYTVSEQFCFETANLARQIDPRITFVAGGPHASFTAHRMLKKCAAIDIVAHLEAEETLLAIAECLSNGGSPRVLPGLSYRHDTGTVVTNPYRPLKTRLDALPVPAKDLLADEYYEKYHATGVITARGCAYRCDFCVSPQFFDGVRQRDLGCVAQELECLMSERDIRHVRFYDDVFAYNAPKLRRVRDTIGPLQLTYDCYIRVDVTTPEMLELMRESGCVQVRFGVETGAQELRSLRKGGRTVSFEKHRQVVDVCRQLGIETQASYILGFPGETRADMLDTIYFADRLDTDTVGFYKLTPYPGTKYWAMLDEDAVPLRNHTKFDNEVSLNEHMTSAEIFNLLRTAYETFYRRRKLPLDRPDTLRFLTSLPKIASSHPWGPETWARSTAPATRASTGT